MPKLSDIKIEKILGDYKETKSCEETAKRNNVSARSVQKLVDEYSPEKFDVKCRIKAMEIINMYMDELSKSEKIKAAPLNQLASALGVLIDKVGKMEKDSETENIISLIESIKE